MNNIVFFLIVVFGFVIYFLPWFIANDRKHPNASAIGVLNLLLGWTFLGWVIALVWANTSNRQQMSIVLSAGGDDTKKCPFCAEIIMKEAKFCRFCGKELSINSTNNYKIKAINDEEDIQTKIEKIRQKIRENGKDK